MRKFYFSLTLVLASSFCSVAQTTLSYRITNWQGNKKAAVCLTFDDNCSGQFLYALPYLQTMQFTGTFYVITRGSQCNVVNWNDVTNAYNDGHEIGCHTVTHPNLAQVTLPNSSALDLDQIRYELTASADTINARYPGQGFLTLAWPFGGGGGSTIQEDTVRTIALSTNKYIGARNASVNQNGYESYVPWTSNNFNFRVGAFLIDNTVTGAQIVAIADSASNHSGWFTILYHGIQDVGFNLIPQTLFEQHMDSLNAHKSNLWIAPFRDAHRYHHEIYGNPQLTVKSETSSAWTLSLSDTLPNNAIYNVPLTLRLQKPAGWSPSQITQNGQSLTWKTEIDTIEVNAVPDGGDIVFDKVVTSLADYYSRFQNNVMNVFPNPASGQTKVVAQVIHDGPIAISLINTRGEVINKYTNQHSTAGTFEYVLPLDNVPPGLYVLQYSSSYITDTKKLSVK